MPYKNPHSPEAVASLKRRQEKHQKTTKYRNRYRSYYLKKNFGISQESYSVLLDSQNGLCAICGKPEAGLKTDYWKRSLSVDHNHSTGKIRGLLCANCNTALGLIREDEGILVKMINYIKKYK